MKRISTMPRQQKIVTLRTEKFVHGGQALAHDDNGTPVFVWGALPGELVEVAIYRQKRQFAEARVERVIEPSVDRVSPRDDAFMSTSPWQIVSERAEQRHKAEILEATMKHEGVELPAAPVFHSTSTYWHYRNKMEYSFYGDDDGLHLALFQRGSRAKRIVEGSSIANPIIDETAQAILQVLRQADIRAGDLKSLIVRSNQAGEAVAALFVKQADFLHIDQLDGICQGIAVYYSTPKSPASVVSRKLYCFGDTTLRERVLGHELRYDVLSFFQVNVAEFTKSLEVMRPFLAPATQKVDFYAGVGAFVGPLGIDVMVEIDEANITFAQDNVDPSVQIVHASAESALEFIPTGKGAAMTLDPPRAGLHKKVVDRLLSQQPERIAYLSCNPITQARDIAHLQTSYELRELHGFNFFPRTPHIESLALLELRSK